jgi:hypothetical protein
MSVIATAIEPPGIVRVFFDLSQSTPQWQDERLIARTFEYAVDNIGHPGGLTQPVPHATDAAPWPSKQLRSSTPPRSASMPKRRR